MIKTHSKFYFNLVITSDNQYIDFVESAVPKVATLKVGSYTLTTLVLEIERALNAAGDLTYTVSVNRTTRKITIAASGVFSLLPVTGASSGATALVTLGFTADKSGAATYLADSASGSEYVPPFLLQDYLAPEDNAEAIDSVEAEACDGTVQAVSFGSRSAVELNIKWVRAENYDDGVIKTTVNSVTELRTFMQYLRLKHPVEFMPDRDKPAEFYTLRLTATPSNQNGDGFRLNELYTQGLPGWYETGILKFRVIT